MNPIDSAYDAVRGMERAVSGLLLIAYTRLGQDEHGEAIRVLDETIEQLANTPRFNSLIDILARLSDWIEAGQVSDTREILRELITKMGDEFHQEIIARQEMA
tara:strand:+ start:64 stop:372 length:309 start_codon:yes stop_codon:yes gene_type:complete